MPVIDHIDPINRDIYLHADTVGVDLEPMDIYREMRALRKSDETLRPFDVFLTAKGRDPKGGGKYTERYVVCNLGTRIIPYDTSQELTVVGTIITDDEQEGTACFDRTPLSPTTQVDINYVPKQVEVIEINTGSGITQQDKDDITAGVWAELMEAGLSYEVAMKAMASILLGKLSGAGTGTEAFRDLADILDRVISVCDENGNRSSVTINVS